ncbi:helix-turn-helix domain-containing protein [Streptomyces tendae]|uniref:helix-turn-helix domain-containing protein n=1 Tax=Streptomyces tendae TaxID=1932 RepID=UPI0036586974
MTTEHAPLVAALRELRARTGLSLAALAERTAYSKSSWERYLNGRALPPRQAVVDLCRVADEPEGRLTALWEIAEAQWSARGAASAAPAPTPRPPAARPAPDPVRPHGRRGRLMVMLTSAYVLLAGGIALALFLLPGRGTADDEPLSAPVPHSTGPQCRGAACEGLDPIRLICGINPDTLTTYRTATGAHVELRHSRKCGASWARAWGTAIGDRVEVTAGGPAHEVRVANRDDTETYVYTGMAAARPGSTVRACFSPASPDGERECVEARVGTPASPQ